MKYLTTYLLSISWLFSFVFFDSEDWIYLKKVGSIDFIAEDDDLVHFITNNGIYSYDDINENYYYNFDLSNSINFNNKIYYFYFDSNTNIYWLIDEENIKMKHSFSSFWSEISFRKLNIIDVNEIIDIGNSFNFIWIKLFDRIIPLNPITGFIVDNQIDNIEFDNIQWSNKYNENEQRNIDLSRYVIFDGWNIGIDKITNSRGDVLNSTVFFEDQNNNVWFGTREGVILKGSTYSHRLEIVDFGLKFYNVTTAILDDDMNWWFGDSQFLRTGIKRYKQNFSKNNYDFITKWDVIENSWKYFSTDYSMLIQNIDINDLLYINNVLYIATMDGLLIYDKFDDDWIKIDSELYDKAVWDIEYYENSIFLATSNGYNEISSISRNIIKNYNSLSDELFNTQIYDILISDDIMYIASEKGLFEKNFNINTYQLLSDKQFRNIRKFKDYIFANDRDIWKINLLTSDIEKIESDVINFSISQNFIWLNHGEYCELLEMDTYRSWKFNLEEEIPGSIIYKVESKDNKVWFMTNDGVAIYNWDSTDYE